MVAGAPQRLEWGVTLSGYVAPALDTGPVKVGANEKAGRISAPRPRAYATSPGNIPRQAPALHNIDSRTVRLTAVSPFTPLFYRKKHARGERNSRTGM